MKRILTTFAVLTTALALAGDFSQWEPDTNLVATVEPHLKKYCWNHSDQRRELAKGEVRVEVDSNASNIVVHMPDVSIRETFTMRGLAYSDYFRRAEGFTADAFRYLEVQFSPTPLTNEISFSPITFCGLVNTSPVPFKVYVDLQNTNVVHEWDWWKYRREKTSNQTMEGTQCTAQTRFGPASRRLV